MANPLQQNESELQIEMQDLPPLGSKESAISIALESSPPPLIGLKTLPSEIMAPEIQPLEGQNLGNLVYKRAVGIDVHSDSMVVCLLTLLPGDCLQTEFCKSNCNDQSLDLLVKKIEEYCPQIICLESTGIYWQHLYDKLDAVRRALKEAGKEWFHIHVVNARDYKQRLGSKTDRNDSLNLARYALFKDTSPSFIPCSGVRESRVLHRTLVSNIQSNQQHKNRLHKIFKQVGINVDSVFSKTQGEASCILIMEALHTGNDPDKLQQLSSHIEIMREQYGLKADTAEIPRRLYASRVPIFTRFCTVNSA